MKYLDPIRRMKMMESIKGYKYISQNEKIFMELIYLIQILETDSRTTKVNIQISQSPKRERRRELVVGKRRGRGEEVG